MISKAETTAWTRRYRAALRQFLQQNPSVTPVSAKKLGDQAVALDLKTLVVASIHKRVLKAESAAENISRNVRQERLKQADTFFKETIVPIEATHRAARKAGSRIGQLTRQSQQRAAASSASDKQLEQAITLRKAAEENAHAHEASHDKLLTETLGIQKSLRDQIRKTLSQQEGDRQRLSNKLRNEIAQALISIDLSLLALKTYGKIDTDKTEKSIEDAQRIMKVLQRQEHLSDHQQERV